MEDSAMLRRVAGSRFDMGTELEELMQEFQAFGSKALDKASPAAVDAIREGRLVNGFTFLHCAVARDDVDAALDLLQLGAPVDAGTEDGRTSLYVAAADGSPRQVDMITLLLEHGADLHSRTEQHATPLHIASQRGCAKAVSTLIEAGSDITARTRAGKAAVQLACENGHLDLAKHLHAMSSSLIFATTKWDFTTLHTTVANNSLPCVRWLLELGLDVNAQTSGGLSPLMFALK